MEQKAPRVACVTGGAAGIGQATALQLALQHHCAVVVADLDKEGGEAVASEIRGQGGVAEFLEVDVSDEGSVSRLYERVRARFGRLDFAVNNAGVEGERGRLHKQSTADFDRVLSVNARGVWLCMKHQIPLMLESGQGAIVVTSSTAGIRGMPEFSPYSASKHALLGIVRSAALEYAGQLRINAVAPATTDTPMVARFAERWPEWQAATNASYPIGRVATADEVARAAVWLCIGATFSTGSVLVLDGGSTC